MARTGGPRRQPGRHRPKLLPRRRGLPNSGIAAVLPAFDADGALSYVQARYLDPSLRSKYGNPTRRLGTNPGLAWTRTQTPRHPGVLIVCEGIIDALTAASAGLNAVAVLGATYPSITTADAIAAHADGREVMVAFDGDEPGQTAARRLYDLLTARNVVSCLWDLPAGVDLNNLALTDPNWAEPLIEEQPV